MGLYRGLGKREVGDNGSGGGLQKAAQRHRGLAGLVMPGTRYAIPSI